MKGRPKTAIASPGVAFPGPVSTMLAALVLSLIVGGCTNLGPRALRAGRNDYNVAIQQTNDEQLLLNLVRLRYRDTPLFLEVSSVTTQFAFSAGATGSATIRSGPDQGGLGASLAYAEEPTVAYTPLQGEDFVERFLAPISLDTILLLYHSGWSFDRVLRVAVQHLNGLENASSASGPTPARAPDFRQFREAATLLRELQRRKLLSLGYEERDGKKRPVVQLTAAALSSAEALALVKLLGLTAGQARYAVQPGVSTGEADAISVGTRSLMGVLFYLSHAVEVPRADEAMGRVTVTQDDTGQRFDWLQVTDALLHIKAQEERPDNAAVAIRYRGLWFYIDNSDLDSKSTFSLLAQLFALQSGKAEGIAPVLTIPIGR